MSHRISSIIKAIEKERENVMIFSNSGAGFDKVVYVSPFPSLATIFLVQLFMI